MIGLYLPGMGARQVIETTQQAEAHGVPAIWLTMGGTGADATIVFGRPPWSPNASSSARRSF
jgi:hypothetical protein